MRKNPERRQGDGDADPSQPPDERWHKSAYYARYRQQEIKQELESESEREVETFKQYIWLHLKYLQRLKKHQNHSVIN